MNKRIILGGAGALAIIAVIAGAQMLSSNENISDDLVTDVDDNPFSSLGQMIDEGSMQEMTEEEVEAEDEFLDMRIADEENAPAGPEGIENVPYSSCEKEPETLTSEYRRGTDEASTTRHIYSYLRYQNVLATEDCTCAGKVPSFEGVQVIRDQLAEDHGEDWDRSTWGAHYLKLSFEMKTKAEAFCGGDF